MMRDSTLRDAAVVWEHRLGNPMPVRIDAEDDSIDEVRLRGTFNLPTTSANRVHLLCEARRVLKPGGRLLLRMLKREHAAPALSGPGAVIRFVPAKDELMQLVSTAGFTGLRLLKYDDPPCFVHDGVSMRETHIESFKYMRCMNMLRTRR